MVSPTVLSEAENATEISRNNRQLKLPFGFSLASDTGAIHEQSEISRLEEGRAAGGKDVHGE